MRCRFCGAPLVREFLNLGTSPSANAFLDVEGLNRGEVYYPLKLYVCDTCLLVQLDAYRKSEELFGADYAYFSSYSSTWLAHARDYAETITARRNLSSRSRVVELASNDGYLLQYFKAKAIPCLGIEPSLNTAQAAMAKGIPTRVEFFGADVASRVVAEQGHADLVIANNVLAHVPDIHDFVSGIQILLAPHGVATIEFPHLARLVAGVQFDTVYHEHYSYFSLLTSRAIFAAHGLRLEDVEELPTHGGSLRVHLVHDTPPGRPDAEAARKVLGEERAAGMDRPEFYAGFQAKAEAVKDALLAFLLDCKRQGKLVAAYGAAAKGNTLLNFCGIRSDMVGFVVDASPHKQGKFLPGSRIPVVDETEIRKQRPDVVLLLPWNIQEELFEQLSYIGQWGGVFATAIPRLRLQTPRI
ncbi:class I SAM-dependent methyltransferase [Desulfolutivibrio sulfoxidireducens]|uniref:class I SAM-dependent methyltransferase n=1 Tax=Desulfolutivibrio sulfoxidireducens TaxID=2773299 RepID=UPI00159DE114|nr:class I SAM-dependent methyltransferase [Desulfolutivibrio sulfoxidireducens]QLA18214.1 methyltransferase domain-containing protein [Desulfolutivibrio sulfoxidireducens]